MRIAYITQSYPPMVSGASLVVQSLAENMADRGHKVLVLAASDRRESYRTIKGNLTVLRLGSYENPLRVGQRFMLFPYRTFMQVLRKFQPDLIHSHDPLMLGNLALIYKRNKRIPALLTAHALPNFAAKYVPAVVSNLQPFLEASLWMYACWHLRQYESVSTPTPTTSGLIYSVTKVQPVSISNGVDLDIFSNIRLNPDREFALRIRLGLPLDVPVILYVGRLDVDKRVERVIRAVAQAMQTNEAHLLIVGDGRQKLALIKLCKSLGVADRCHFPGYVAMQDGLSEIYRMASLFVTASEIETQGIVLLEAAASGLPIVAARATCIPEIVHEGLNGYLAEPGDICALSKAITCLLEDPDRARRMGKAGRALVGEHNIHITMEHYEKLYSDLILKNEVQYKAIKIRSYWKRAREWMNL